MSGEGFKIAQTILIGFVILALASLGAVTVGKIEPSALKDLYTSLAILAGVLGVPGVLAVWVVSRGQTTSTPSQAIPSEYVPASAPGVSGQTGQVGQAVEGGPGLDPKDEKVEG